MLRQLARALAPALSEVRVDWGGLAATQAPHEVPPVFSDGRVLLFAKLEKQEPGTVTLRAVGSAGPVSFTLPIDPASAGEGTLVGTLWARRMIQDLEEGRSPLHPRRGSHQARALGLKDEKVKAEIVSLGTTWSLVSRHTSFVAVEERQTPTEGEAQLRKVPVAITRGWHGLGDPRFGSGALLRAACGRAPMAMGAAMMFRDEDASAPETSFFASMVDRRGVPPAQPAMERARPPVRPLDSLVALQRADGSWKLTAELARILGWPDLRRLLQALGRPLAGPPEERAAATALALAWLERECPDTLDEWRMLATKAREWLDRTPEGAEVWLQLADAALARR